MKGDILVTKSKEQFLNGEDQLDALIKYRNSLDEIVINKETSHYFMTIFFGESRKITKKINELKINHNLIKYLNE